ncbi:MAG: hypothetical protein DMF69_22290 [Acidobacteria bacterium]|nr:MAG: hypothetical protein DMF69_22290 [Acidobacteriota bacterium]
MKTYSIKLSKKHRGFLTLLNDGVDPLIGNEKLERYLLIHVSDDGRDITTKVVKKRELLQFDRVLDGFIVMRHAK